MVVEVLLGQSDGGQAELTQVERKAVERSAEECTCTTSTMIMKFFGFPLLAKAPKFRTEKTP